jgi:hypothetical protein
MLKAVAAVASEGAMLPPSKNDFPKCLYLDQNKWIDLARARYRRAEGEPFQDSLRAVQAAVEAGKLAVPFSVINALEAMAPRDSGRRDRLARFMVDLSGNRTVLPCFVIWPWEVRNAIYQLFGRPEPTAIRPALVRRGLANAFGKVARVSGPTAEVELAALREIQSPEMTLELLVEAGDARDRVEQARASDEKIASFCERVRERANADLTPEQRRAAEFALLLFEEGPTRPMLTAAREELGFTLTDFQARVNPREAFNRFTDSIPTLDVMVTLTVARDKDLVRPIHRNDLRDLVWLSVALPYSNVFVSENYWGHQVHSTGLDGKYGTVLITDLRQLPEQLQAMGCTA